MVALENDLGAEWLLDLWETVPTPDKAARSREVTNAKILKRHRIRRFDAAHVLDGLRQPPVQVAAGTVNDPRNKTLHQVDVAVLGHADGTRPPLLAIGEAKWNEQMGLGHLERLRRIRDLLAANAKLDTSGTRLVCFSGAGFTDDLKQRGRRGDVDLVGLEDLYSQGS